MLDAASAKALLDPLRNRLFEQLREPRSVPDLAVAVGKPTDRLYYHVNRLTDAGLVEEVGTQRSGRHIERIYRRTAKRVRFSGDVSLDGEGPLRGFTDELDRALIAAGSDDPASVSYHAGGLTDERAVELADRLRALVAEYDDPHPPAGARRFGILGVVVPLEAAAAASVRIRDLDPGEIEFLREMLIAALAWRPGVSLPATHLVLAHPQVSVFHEGWGRAGDTALVAEVGGRPIGLAWYRLFTDAAHGEGFIDEKTPELAIAVVEGFRGKGIGRRLLAAAHDRARADGHARLSLSVDPDNPAKRLYASVGYREYEPEDDLGRMVIDVGEGMLEGDR